MICGMCNGTGCRDCNNSGEVAVKPDDDFDPPDDDYWEAWEL